MSDAWCSPEMRAQAEEYMKDLPAMTREYLAIGIAQDFGCAEEDVLRYIAVVWKRPVVNVGLLRDSMRGSVMSGTFRLGHWRERW